MWEVKASCMYCGLGRVSGGEIETAGMWHGPRNDRSSRSDGGACPRVLTPVSTALGTWSNVRDTRFTHTRQYRPLGRCIPELRFQVLSEKGRGEFIERLYTFHDKASCYFFL